MREHCAEPYFSFLSKGEKTIEGRVYRRKWKDIIVGQKIEFFCDDMSIICEVIAIHHAKSFAALYEQFGHRLLPNADSIDEAIEIYRSFGYTESDEAQNGVVGFEIRLH